MPRRKSSSNAVKARRSLAKVAEPKPPEIDEAKIRAASKALREKAAEVCLGPEYPAAAVIAHYPYDGVSRQAPESYWPNLQKASKAVQEGDLRGIEATLTSQAAALNGIFAELACRAALNMGEHVGFAETYLKLALRAQSQCRATLETLANIKNPPSVAFVKQANIAHGHQQVNNGTPVARVEKSANPPNELLGNDHGERLDFGTTCTAGRGDPAMATVGAIDGAKDSVR